ncbi:MAG TPA: PQQ-binding-like beta-propeller repeat protein [Thermomicrobiales bacterium]|nr:PQQ-binding-like beta-propeller repeat protein [Thermomicrobiales bacterium]
MTRGPGTTVALFVLLVLLTGCGGGGDDKKDATAPATLPAAHSSKTPDAAMQSTISSQAQASSGVEATTIPTMALTERPASTATAPTPATVAPTSPPAAEAADVPFLGADLARTGAHPGPAGQVQIVWRFKASGGIDRAPILVDGTVYVPSHDGSLYAIDATTRAQRWQFTGNRTGNGRDFRLTTPAVIDGVVYAGNRDGAIYAIDAASGEQRWSFQTGGSVDSFPAAAEGIVYAGSSDGTVYALDLETGSQR